MKVCRKRPGSQHKSPQPPRGKPVHHLDENSDDDSDSDLTGTLYTMNSNSKTHPYVVNIEVSGKPLQVEIDTGASLTLVSERTFHEYSPMS